MSNNINELNDEVKVQNDEELLKTDKITNEENVANEEEVTNLEQVANSEEITNLEQVANSEEMANLGEIANSEEVANSINIPNEEGVASLKEMDNKEESNKELNNIEKKAKSPNSNNQDNDQDNTEVKRNLKSDKNKIKLNKLIKDSNGDKFSKNWMTFYIVTLVVLVFSELYVTVQSKSNYIVFAGLLIVIAIFCYLSIDEFIKLFRVIREHQDHRLDLHIKSQKAIYSVINKKMDLVNNNINQMNLELKENNETYSNIMKAVAKVIIKKNHEFSNNIIGELSSLKNDRSDNDDNSVDLSELINKIEEIENNISNSLNETNKRNNYIEQLITLIENSATDFKESKDAVIRIEEALSKIEDTSKVKTKKKLDSNSDTKKTTKTSRTKSKKTDDVKVEDEIKVEADIIEGNIKDQSITEPNREDQNIIKQDIENINNIADKDITMPVEDNKSEESMLEPGSSDNSQNYKVEIPEEIDLTDPNKQLSPEEISALFASIQ